MSRLRLAARIAATIVLGTLLPSGGLAANAQTVAAPDRSEVVLVLDFSASILRDEANRARFAGALDRIADRVDATSAVLIAGDTTVSILQFAARAVDYEACTDLRLLGDAGAVTRFAECLRSVAAAYRAGLDPALTRTIGIDTNYVAAMDQAATHIPPDAVRPALILFTDGKHDVAGVPASQVPEALDRNFGTRSPLALLPVGMGLEASERGVLETGLAAMRIIRDMPPCIGGATFDWPQVVFESADDAGNAVGVALQEATCTFTVVATPPPEPTDPPAIPAVSSIRLTPRDGEIEVTWGRSAATASAAPIVDYRVRCGPGDDTWVDSEEGVSLEPTAIVDGLTNGTPYICEVAAVVPSGEGPWTPASESATPDSRPLAPAIPTVEALDRSVQISVAPGDPTRVTGYHYECSGDNGTTWPDVVDVPSADETTTRITNLTNGVAYVCRAFAVNAIGTSEPSPMSAPVRPCASAIDCNPTLAPIFAGLGIALAGALLAMLVVFARSRRRGYVLATVDGVHTANLGYGSKLGIAFVRAPDTRQLISIVADRSKNADVHVRHVGSGRFVVRDPSGRHVATAGEPIIVSDGQGGRHQVILRAFDTKAASPVSSRR